VCGGACACAREQEERKQEWSEKVEVRQYPTLEEVNSVKLGRSLLEKWLDQPFFEKTVPRFFVRVGIGMNREQQNAYRMAQIVGTRTHTRHAHARHTPHTRHDTTRHALTRACAVGGAVAEKGPRTYTVGKKKTQYMLKLSHGGNSKNFSIEYVSNAPITMPEYERWLREVDKAHMDIPTPADIEARRRDLESTRHYVYTHVRHQRPPVASSLHVTHTCRVSCRVVCVVVCACGAGGYIADD
jgi:RNA polymerase-associated protein RTF1